MNTTPEHVPDRHLDSPVREVDLVAQARECLREAGSGHSARTLAKQGLLRVVLLALAKGAHIPSHHAAAPISLQVLSGRLRFTVGGQDKELAPGRVLVVAADLPHDLTAHEETVALLTLAGA